jgi:hypothetical protein
MRRVEFLRQMTLLAIDAVQDIMGMYVFRRLKHRLIWGTWCKHHSWTPWERMNDQGLMLRTCEGCMIRQTK